MSTGCCIHSAYNLHVVHLLHPSALSTKPYAVSEAHARPNQNKGRTAMRAESQGTKQPACAISTATPTCRANRWWREQMCTHTWDGCAACLETQGVWHRVRMQHVRSTQCAGLRKSAWHGGYCAAHRDTCTSCSAPDIWTTWQRKTPASRLGVTRTRTSSCSDEHNTLLIQ